MRVRALLALVLFAALVTPAARLAEASHDTPPPPLPGCSPNDLPETGIQGDVPLADQQSGRAELGYNCGLSLVGYDPIGARGSNANMAWVGHCAYIAGDGVAVIDVSDPAHPRHVRTLHGPGSTDTLETIAAVETGDRAVLAAGRYGLFGNADFFPGEAPVDLYDVSGDCTDPVLTTTFHFPSNVHNLTISADGTTLWSTLPTQAADITDLANPVFLGDLDAALRAEGVHNLYYSHEVWPSPDGDTVYMGGQIVGMERSYIIDVSAWPAEPPNVLSVFPGVGHSVRDLEVGSRHLLLHSDESIISPLANSCLPRDLTPIAGPAEPYLTDITDPTRPEQVGKLRLAINDRSNCLAQLASGVNASAHYHDVDDREDASFAMVSMWNAGLRIFDVRDPSAPREVAYFNPGKFPAPGANPDDPVGTFLSLTSREGLDQAWAHVRYVPETGHIWLTTSTGGFWVLELAPQLREFLELPALPSAHPRGAAPRPQASQAAAFSLAAATPPGAYCTINTLTSIL